MGTTGIDRAWVLLHPSQHVGDLLVAARGPDFLDPDIIHVKYAIGMEDRAEGVDRPCLVKLYLAISGYRGMSGV